MTIKTEGLFIKEELIPVIIQDSDTLRVLMLGYTNREAYELTLKQNSLVLQPQQADLMEQGRDLGQFSACG